MLKVGNKFKLYMEVCKRSHAKSCKEAMHQWELCAHYDYREESDEYSEICLCGHDPIKELFYFKNKLTGEVILVGNCCQKRFFPSIANNILTKFIHKNKINKDVIILSWMLCVLSDWEYKFMLDVYRKRKFSDKQFSKWTSAKNKIYTGLRKYQEKRGMLERKELNEGLRLLLGPKEILRMHYSNA